MPKPRKLEDAIAQLKTIQHEPTSEAGLAVLREVIGSKHAVAVAEAAHLVGEWEITSLIPDLVPAFDRFLLNAKDSDPGCRAKQAIAETLYRLSYSDETLFLQGIRHIQKEPIWGGQVDTAPRLRGTCALGLVRMNYPQVMVELADLLADPEPEARIGAARAIAYTENDQGIPLLRLRVRVGDTAPILAECLIALLQLDPIGSLPLTESLLYAKKELEPDAEKAEAAALALGASRLPEAFARLRDWWQQTKPVELRQTALLAIATLRQDDALNFLLALIAEGMQADAKAAIKALLIYRQDAALWERIQRTIEQRGDAKLLQIVAGK